MRFRCERVRIPIALLRSLSDKYPWESYAPSYAPDIGWIVSLSFFYKDGFGFGMESPKAFDMPFNKETKPRQKCSKLTFHSLFIPILVYSASVSILFNASRILSEYKNLFPRKKIKLTARGAWFGQSGEGRSNPRQCSTKKLLHLFV